MARVIETDVTIIGAGPVGLTLAMDLASRGVNVTILEVRYPGEPPSVKCNHVAARSMEIFRRLGVASKVRAAGLPADYPHDVAFRTTMVERELTAHPDPLPARPLHVREGPDTGWPTPEPPHRINRSTSTDPLRARPGAAWRHRPQSADVPAPHARRRGRDGNGTESRF